LETKDEDVFGVRGRIDASAASVLESRDHTLKYTLTGALVTRQCCHTRQEAPMFSLVSSIHAFTVTHIFLLAGLQQM